MLTPILIQVIFWLILAYCLFVGVYDLARHTSTTQALEVLILGPIAARIASEILILFFSMNETLTDIKNINEHNKAK